MGEDILRIEWNGGVHIEYDDVKVVLDPKRNSVNSSAFFVTHGHFDHSAAFRMKNVKKYSSKETLEIVSNFFSVKGSFPLNLKEKTAIGEVEVIPHNSGHVLGSFEYEVRAPEGTILYTGDFNTEKTKTMKPAEPVHCDVLIVEATFGSPNFVFPGIDEISEDMVKWARSVLKRGRIPVFRTDPLGNAQEIIHIFNECGFPVITHRRVTLMNKVYERHGYSLEYIDEWSSEAEAIKQRGGFVYVSPKNAKISDVRFEDALVSGWALWSRRTGFPLSDHADFPRIIRFVEECDPKIVLTCHGGRFNETLARYVERKMHIRAYPIDLIPTRFRKEKR